MKIKTKPENQQTEFLYFSVLYLFGYRVCAGMDCFKVF